MGFCGVTNDYVAATQMGNATTVKNWVTLWSSAENAGAPKQAGAYMQTNEFGQMTLVNGDTNETIWSTPIPENQQNWGSYWGSYGDSSDRRLPIYVDGGNWNYTVDSCRQEAINEGQPYYGVQAVGSNGLAQCFLGSDMEQAQSYGIETNLGMYVNGMPSGGGWVNSIYGTTPGFTSFLIVQDDGNVVIYRGNGTNDNQGQIWASGTNGKQQDNNPNYVASQGRYGSPQMSDVGSTLYPNQWLANTDGNTVLYMQPDGNLVIYTFQMESACQKMSNGKIGAVGTGTALYGFD